MILVAGGQLDHNIGRILRRLIERGEAFCDLLVGPELLPRFTLDLRDRSLALDGKPVEANSCFMRHDVFMQEKLKTSDAGAAALNWFYAVRGWTLLNPHIRTLNRHSYLSENNKVENLALADEFGLRIPETLITNEIGRISRPDIKEFANWIQKPVAGGDYTTLLSDLPIVDDISNYPRFIQPRLLRPEMRVYRIGSKIIGFKITSDDLDYRTTHQVSIESVDVPSDISSKLIKLCDHLGLDFCASDFMLDGENEYCFLEINTQPMFATFDKHVGGRLCDAIIDFLNG